MSAEFEEDVLRALRRITRAIDLHSRHLATTYGLTGPQLVCLRVIEEEGPISPSKLAQEVSLSQGTITGIVDRLANRQLVTRERSETDRRAVAIAMTTAGRKLIKAAPSPLQEKFSDRLGSLSAEEQAMIRLSLNKIVRLMDGSEIDAAPVLATEAQLGSPTDVTTPGAVHSPPSTATKPGRRSAAPKRKGGPAKRKRGPAKRKGRSASKASSRK